MKQFVTASLLTAILLTGCASGPGLSIKDIQPKRVFRLTRTEVFDAVRLFGIREGIRLASMDEESGRIIGHCTLQGRTNAVEGKMIIMNLRVYPVDSSHSEVNARFTFSSLTDALTREEESMLVDYYQNLYSFLERKAE